MSTADLQQIGQRREQPNRVLILGSTGMVGRSWCEMLDRLGIEYRALARPAFDLLDPATVEQAVHAGDQLVVNAAAWTDVDGAESDPDGANQANGHSVAALAQRCKDLGAMLIHYSTDYVFDGRATTPYPVDAPINPCNAYGRSKAIGESGVRDSRCEHLIIRTSWVYAPWGKNFVRTIAGLAKDRDELRVVDDQHGRPTSAQYLAETSLDFYRHGASGTWHATDGDQCTWHTFATAIAEAINPACVVHPCASDTYPRPAFRPEYSVLDINATEAVCGRRRAWRQNLSQALEAME